MMKMNSLNFGAASGDMAGFMPRQSQLGYIFLNKNETLNRTIAHELGHGFGSMSHTFNAKYGSLTQGSTDNLMDYGDSIALQKLQWDALHSNIVVWKVFERDKDGKAIRDNILTQQLIDNLKLAISKKEIFNLPNIFTLCGPKVSVGNGDSCSVMILVLSPKMIDTKMPFHNGGTLSESEVDKSLCYDVIGKYTTLHFFKEQNVASLSLIVPEKYTDKFLKYLYPEWEKKIEPQDNTSYLDTVLVSPIISANDFSRQGGNCYETCVEIMKRHDTNYTAISDAWALATRNDKNNILIHQECYAEAVIALSDAVESGIPVIVGVNYMSNNINFDKITDHWVIVNGKGKDHEGVYFTYYDVAQPNTDISDNGTSTEKNRFYLRTDGYLEGKNKTVSNAKNAKYPIVTAIRMIPSNPCCSRSFYEDTATNRENKCNNYYNLKTNSKGTLIKIREK